MQARMWLWMCDMQREMAEMKEEEEWEMKNEMENEWVCLRKEGRRKK